MKLEDLPEALSRREFRAICQREGIPVQPGAPAGRMFAESNEQQFKNV